MRSEFQQLIDEMMSKGPQLGFSHQDVQEMGYAIVALIDELALRGPNELSQEWVGNLLQMAYFDENMAGENFFKRLENLKSSRRYEPLRVYYLSLLLGFKGRYQVRGGDMELADIISSVRYTLANGGLDEPEQLSPAGEPPKETLNTKSSGAKFMWLPAGAVVAAIALYIGLATSLAGHAESVAEYISTLIN